MHVWWIFFLGWCCFFKLSCCKSACLYRTHCYPRAQMQLHVCYVQRFTLYIHNRGTAQTIKECCFSQHCCGTRTHLHQQHCLPSLIGLKSILCMCWKYGRCGKYALCRSLSTRAQKTEDLDTMCGQRTQYLQTGCILYCPSRWLRERCTDLWHSTMSNKYNWVRAMIIFQLEIIRKKSIRKHKNQCCKPKSSVIEMNLKLFSAALKEACIASRTVGSAFDAGFLASGYPRAEFCQSASLASAIAAVLCWNLRREGFTRLREMRCKIEFGNPLVEWARVQAPAVCNRRPRALSKRHHGDDGRRRANNQSCARRRCAHWCAGPPYWAAFCWQGRQIIYATRPCLSQIEFNVNALRCASLPAVCTLSFSCFVG